MAELSVGQVTPFFELPDQQDYPWSLSGQLEAGPAVLVFYRGDWCAYSNGQLASFARKYDRFEQLGAQVAGISVDPPRSSAQMVGKLRLPFPLLSDPTGELCRACGLWDGEASAAVPAVLVAGRSGEVRYLYAGRDYADLPTDEEVFAALDNLDEDAQFGSRIERLTGGPELRTTASEARDNSVRPNRSPMDLEELLSHCQGAYSTTVVLEKRVSALGWSGRKASREVSRHQTLLRDHARAAQDTFELHRREPS